MVAERKRISFKPTVTEVALGNTIVEEITSKRVRLDVLLMFIGCSICEKAQTGPMLRVEPDHAIGRLLVAVAEKVQGCKTLPGFTQKLKDKKII